MAVIGAGPTAALARIFCAAFSQELDREKQVYNKQVRAVLRLQVALWVKRGRLVQIASGLRHAATLQVVVRSAVAAKQELQRQRRRQLHGD
eukprot:6411597-Amphidinium_carterae.1